MVLYVDHSDEHKTFQNTLKQVLLPPATARQASIEQILTSYEHLGVRSICLVSANFKWYILVTTLIGRTWFYVLFYHCVQNPRLAGCWCQTFSEFARVLLHGASTLHIP